MYLAYPSKAALLNEIIRIGVRGNDTEVPLNHRDAWTEMLQTESTPDLLAKFASGGAVLMARAAHVLRLGEANATSDPQLAQLRDRGHANIRTDMRKIVSELEHRGALAPWLDVDRATDILFAFVANESPYLRLIEECDWTPDEYAELIQALTAALLTRPTADTGKTGAG